jgi:hypothetical protein
LRLSNAPRVSANHDYPPAFFRRHRSAEYQPRGVMPLFVAHSALSVCSLLGPAFTSLSLFPLTL